MQKETWRDVPNFEGYYQVSDLGNVKSLDRVVNQTGRGARSLKGKMLALTKDTKGYRVVCLLKNGDKKYIRVHQLVAMAFLNHVPCGHKLVVDHKDENKSNNVLSNLRLLTNRENCSPSNSNLTSKYTGVHWAKAQNVWRASIRHNGKKVRLGSHDTELEASNAYQKYLKEVIDA
jgi:hypothetical protein